MDSLPRAGLSAVRARLDTVPLLHSNTYLRCIN